MFTTSSPATSTDARVGGRAAQLRFVPKKGRVAVLLNANAKRVTPKVVESMSRVVPEEDLFFSRSLDDCASIADAVVQRRYDLVFAGGGDGTIVQTMNSLIQAADRAASGLYRPPLPDLGVLRLGTGNALAAAFGSGEPIEDVVRALAGKTPLARPVSLIEERPTGAVFPFASLGYDAQLLNDFHEMVRSSPGSMGRMMSKSLAGYFVALFTRTIPHEFSAERPRLRIVSTGRCSIMDPETDEEVPLATGATLFEGAARGVTFGTTPFYGFELKMFPFAERRSDRFHLRVSTAGIHKLLMNLPAMWKGTWRTPEFLDFLVEGVTIESSVPVPYQSSGDARGLVDKLDVRLSPRTFRVLDDRGADRR
jgi:diacylglycerol kinase family enzyme